MHGPPRGRIHESTLDRVERGGVLVDDAVLELDPDLVQRGFHGRADLVPLLRDDGYLGAASRSTAARSSISAGVASRPASMPKLTLTSTAGSSCKCVAKAMGGSTTLAVYPEPAAD